MVIRCYLSFACASEEALRENISLALSLEKTDARVIISRISDEEAEELGLSGSPSIFINDKELQPLKGAGFS